MADGGDEEQGRRRDRPRQDASAPTAVEDEGWRALTIVLLHLLGTKSVGGHDKAGQSRDLPSSDGAAQQTRGKKSKQTSTAADWEDLLRSDFHAAFSQGEGAMLFGGDDVAEDASLDSCSSQDRDDARHHARMLSSLQCLAELDDAHPPRVPEEERATAHEQAIFDALHLLHEDSRLASRCRGRAWTRRLGTLLLHVAARAGPCMADIEDHYCLLLGSSSRGASDACGASSAPSGVRRRRLLGFGRAPCVMSCVNGILRRVEAEEDGALSDGAAEYRDLMEASCLGGVCGTTSMVLRLFGVLFDPNMLSSPTDQDMALSSNGKDLVSTQRHRDRKAMLAMLDEGIFHSSQLLDDLPMGVSLPLLEAIRRCRLDPPPVDAKGGGWPPAAFDLVGRNDVAEYLSQQTPGHRGLANAAADDASPNDLDHDGLVAIEEFASMVSPDDNRVQEAARLLRSSRPLFRRVPRPPELSDHDYERSK